MTVKAPNLIECDIVGCDGALAMVKIRTGFPESVEAAIREHAQGEGWTVDDEGRDICPRSHS